MKAIILCAGYATRLYPLTLNTPKSLLPIDGKPLLSHIVNKVTEVKDVDSIYVVTNDKFYNHFLKWKENNDNKKLPIKIINDETNSNETRLEGLGDLWYVIEKEKIDDDVLVILGDNYFNFSLQLIETFFKKVDNTVLGVFKLENKSELKKMGVIEIENDKLISFEEKPLNPKSDLISTGIYIFPKRDLEKIKQHMKTDKPKDGPGFLILDWIKNKTIHAFILNGNWFDIGTIETYEKVKNSA